MEAQPHHFVDLPFLPPADIEINLPPPLSVNKLRRINWREHQRARNWARVAHGYLLMAKIRPTRIQRFELSIILDETVVFLDLDNSLKNLIDYLRFVEVIENDAPKNMRKITVEWGHAPLGCRVIVRPCA